MASDSAVPARSRRLELDAWGVVFCGGASLRMGQDKARIELEGRTFLQRGIDTLSGLVPRVLLASGTRERHRGHGLECVLDHPDGSGPLAGLAAVLERASDGRARWLLVLACDMPLARPEVFAALLARARERDADACLLRTERGLEPLFAVYHVRTLPAVRAALERGDRRLDSFHADLRLESVAIAELATELADSARNLNTPHDLEALEEERR
jgi:molybdopterin-guanine dinucleotide biosynthesis protein A